MQQPIIADQAQREQALDPKQSFIVQAPAGSGKTELLIQRYLVLLANVQQAPEEIIAITFTRKAAAEMKERILKALNAANTEAEPNSPHARHTWHLAHAALQRDQENQWNLLENPHRLRIQTIDALCAQLTQAMPLLSQFGTQPDILEDARPLYRSASQAFLKTLNTDSPWIEALKTLLLHLDNQFYRVEDLFVDMLARREQWLPYVTQQDTDTLQQQLEKNLNDIVLEYLQTLQQAIPPIVRDELIALAAYAAYHCQTQENNRLTACFQIKQLPNATIDDLAKWQSLAHLLLTDTFQWRLKIDKKIGFPAPSQEKDPEQKALLKSYKEKMLALLDTLRDNETLRQALQDIVQAPPVHYETSAWQVLAALTTLLPLLVAYLKITFQQQAKVDFSEISQAAFMALGEHDSPSELALALDYKIQHILIDEFQDTSNSQFRLLEKLTLGWQNNDGRSLFIVGDPMQSIYRFREAEVGLFLRAREFGLGDVYLAPLNLNCNFRSEVAIIDWINTCFFKLFPKQEDISLGAVSFSASIAIKQNILNDAVQIHPVSNSSDEAEQVIQIIQQTLLEQPDANIAILVKARSHLQDIIPLLQSQNIAYQATEIETLGQRSVIYDLLALTRALLQPLDRIAWLSILRAPWCGLDLHDLNVLSVDKQKTLYQQIHSRDIQQQLSHAGQQRLQKLLPILTSLNQQKERQNLRQMVEQAWLALSAPACLENNNALNDANLFFQLLEQLERPGYQLDLEQLESKLATLYASSHSDKKNPVEIMTIHKSKGLEFDTVILPGLNRRAALDKQRLLMWMERTPKQGPTALLMAPIKASLQTKDATYDYLRHQDKQKSHYETLRLLYVATTRAKSALHLLASVDVDEGKVKTPNSNSLLGHLWPIVKNPCQQALEQSISPSKALDTKVITEPTPLKRLPMDWQSPLNIVFPSDTTYQAHNRPENLCYQQMPHNLRYLGTVIHRVLQQIGEQGIDAWQQQDLQQYHATWRILLTQTGIDHSYLDQALKHLHQAISHTLSDPRGQWIFNPQHTDAANEYALNTRYKQKTQQIIIDRTFIDHQGQRWIIDYKTAQDTNNNLEAFLAQQQQQYAPQLQHYAEIFATLNHHPIKLGLYFPLDKAWCEWDYMTENQHHAL